MKFARYLNDTQTPEWKKAYIDYRGLKKCIGAIRAEQISRRDSTGTTDVNHFHKRVSEHEEFIVHSLAPHSDPPIEESMTSGAISAIPMQRRHSRKAVPSLTVTVQGITHPHRLTDSTLYAPSQDNRFPPKTPLALHALIPLLPPLHAKFFELLDSELEKIDSFYAEREKEMRERSEQLKEQLSELGLHRQKYYESNANTTTPGWPAKAHRSLQTALFALSRRHVAQSNNQPGLVASESGQGPSETVHRGPSTSEDKSRLPACAVSEPTKCSLPPTKATGNVPTRSGGLFSSKHDLSPQEYQHAKKCLRKAVVEYYRGLEVLNNYRILNLTGFRKALKKYGKVTKVSAQVAYMKERVEPSAFASGAMVNSMLREMEELFAARFERGDKKKAVSRLRVAANQKSHHFSTFRTGLWLGSSIPATVAGLILCLHDNTHISLPSWNILLFVYSILLIPALLALLVGLNLVVWARERINYVFIFEFNVRSRLDHREYFELPAFLLCALAYCFLLSFLQIGPPLVWPLVWVALVLIVMFNPIPNFLWSRSRWWLIKNFANLGTSGFRTVEFTDFWLGDQFCSLVYSFSNLYFIGCLYTRYFPNVPSYATTSSSPSLSMATLKVLPRYFFSSSLVERDIPEVLSSAYDPAIQQAWNTCGTERNWAPYFVLAILPFMVRFLQSLRRYWESKLPTHLINAGKYGMGMMYYFFYFLWRRDGNMDNGHIFILWCLSAIVYALYGCAWDFLMDWSICKPRAKYPLLRQELVYTSQVPLYYFAMVSNFAIRFMWTFYIPSMTTSFVLRTFIVALLEMLRRVAWNFYRLENEHLGNMDQYRVTREVPLPYPVGNPQSNDDDDDDDDDDCENTGQAAS